MVNIGSKQHSLEESDGEEEEETQYIQQVDRRSSLKLGISVAFVVMRTSPF
jgi:hypothetical protein